MIGDNRNFFVQHYDWIAAGVAALALAGAVAMYVCSLNSDPDELTSDALRQIKALKPGGEPVKPTDMAEFTKAYSQAKNPPTVMELDATKGNFLASEGRMVCEKCKAVVASGGKSCPACGFVRAVEEKVLDADGDGLPDSWEKRYGLNSADAADAQADGDGDGFTNAEEYAAKTDPTDKMSHPDYLDYLQVQPPLKQTFLPFQFLGVYKTPSGLKFQFKDPSRKNDYDRGQYRILAGEEVGKSGYVVKEYVPKTEKRKMGGGMEKSVDVSEAVVARKADGKLVRLEVNRKQIPVDTQATLVYTHGEQKNFTVVAGDTIEIMGVKYKIKAIERKAKKAEVSIEHLGSGKTRLISALEQ